jgi:hypothetical protein
VALHEKEVGYQLYAEAVRLASTLFTVRLEEPGEEQENGSSDGNEAYEVTAGHNKGHFFRAKWYEKAAAFVRKEKCAREETLERAEKGLVWKELREIMRFYHKVPLKEFLDYVYSAFPPKTGNEVAKGGLSKAVLLQALRDYNPGTQKMYFPSVAEVPPSWLNLCSEIQKLLNVEYEKLYRLKNKFNLTSRKTKVVPVVTSDSESVDEVEEKNSASQVENDEEKDEDENEKTDNGISTGASTGDEDDETDNVNSVLGEKKEEKDNGQSESNTTLDKPPFATSFPVFGGNALYT